MAAPGGEKENFEKLRALLLGDSFARLDSIETQARRVDAYVGDKSRLEAAVADILVEAFHKAEVTRHKELASAVAPLVVAAIQSEIRNSKDMMVEALYPITGRLVTAAVANAFRDLAELAQPAHRRDGFRRRVAAAPSGAGDGAFLGRGGARRGGFGEGQAGAAA